MRSSRLAAALALALSAPAAAAPGPSLAAGLDAVTNDPFVRRFGVRLSADYGFSPYVRVGITAAAYPDLGEADWTALTYTLVDDVRVAPDISRIMHRVSPHVELVPVRSEASGGRESRLLLRTGLGVVHTQDDLEMLQAVDDPRALATKSQLHPSVSYGFGGELAWPSAGLRLLFDQLTYIETVDSGTLEYKHNALIALEAVWRP